MDAVEETLDLASHNNYYPELFFIGPVKAKAALYYIDSNLLQQENL